MRILLLASLLLLVFQIQIRAQKNVDIARLEYVYNLKNIIGDSLWPNFKNEKFDVPLIYYTDKANIIVNPTDIFLSKYAPRVILQKKGFNVFESILIDSVPFHMSVDIVFGDTVSDYNYRYPFMLCSDVEITQKMIPSVRSTEEWATMVMHEYFHGFQFRYLSFLDFFEKNIVSIPQSVLKQEYKTNDKFRKNIEQENNSLLLAIDAIDFFDIQKHIVSFFTLRENRRNNTILDFDLARVEATYETLEGTARYVEYGLYQYLAIQEPNKILLNTDTCYHSYSDFKEFKLENAGWLYKTDQTTYYYATGFNIARLLDKLGVNYKSRLFVENSLSLEQILKEYVEMNKKGIN